MRAEPPPTKPIGGNTVRRQMSLAILLAVSSLHCGDPSGSNNGSNTGNGSSDGGSNNGVSSSGWTDLTGPAKGADIQRFRIADSSHFWMAVSNGNSGAYSTADGGATWTWHKQGFYGYGLGLLDQGKSVWLVGPQTPALWFSSDSGAHFQPIRTTPSDWLNHIYFFTPQRGIMTSETGNRIHLTTDGGATWTSTEIKNAGLLGAHEMAVLGNDVWIASGADFRPDGGTLVHSADAGQTWEVIKFEDKANDYEGGSLHGIAVLSKDELWVAGSSRQIYHTTDGMKTWTQVKDIPIEFGWFGGIAAQGSHIAAVGNVGRKGIGVYESHDGGKTWGAGYNNPNCGEYCAVAGATFVAPGVAYAWGLGGVFLRYQK